MKTWYERHEKYITISKFVLVVIAIASLIVMMILDWRQTVGILAHMLSILAPFIAALLIAYFLSPLVAKIRKLVIQIAPNSEDTKLLKYGSILVAYVIVLAFLALAFVFVIPQLLESISELVSNIPTMYDKVLQLLQDIQKKYPDLDLAFVTDRLNEMVPDLVNFGTDLVGNVIPWIYNVSVSVVRLAINIILALMISVYMIADKKGFQYQMKRLAYALFREDHADGVCRTCRECNDIFSSFLIGKAVDSLIIGCLCCVIMSIIQLPYAVLLSVVVGITNMIPYFGPFIGAVPGLLIFLCTSPRDAVVFVIMILVLQQFDGLVLGPKILGQSTGLGPLWVIFAITVGGGYFGVLGMFIGVPVVAVIAHLINKGIKYRLGDREIPALESFEAEQAQVQAKQEQVLQEKKQRSKQRAEKLEQRVIKGKDK